jgi:hypothetical protein
MMSYNIFIVEDDPIIASSVRDFLTRYGYRVMKGLAPTTRAIGGHFSPPDWSGSQPCFPNGKPAGITDIF